MIPFLLRLALAMAMFFAAYPLTGFAWTLGSDPAVTISSDESATLVLPTIREVESIGNLRNEKVATNEIKVETTPKLYFQPLEFVDAETTFVTQAQADASISNHYSPEVDLTVNFNSALPHISEYRDIYKLDDFPFSNRYVYTFDLGATGDSIAPTRATRIYSLKDPFSLAGHVNAPLYGGAMDSTLVDLVHDGGTMRTYSDADGFYNFVNVPPGAISLAAKLPMEPSARVTTYDMLRIGQHLLEIQEFDDPFILLAADVNKSGNISAFDLTAIRRVILGLDPAFAGEHEVTTVGANHTFSNEDAPWMDANNWGTQFPYVSSDVLSHDISAIKLGDINPQVFLQQRGASELILQDKQVQANESIEMLVRNDYQMAISGLQLAVEAEGHLLVGAADENIDVQTNEVNGVTRISILQELLAGEPAMTWTFTPRKAGLLSELVKISNDIPNESYSAEDFHPAQLALYWESTSLKGSLAELSAFPNPFDNHLSISAHLTKAGKHMLRVTDMTGRSFAYSELDVEQDSWHNLRFYTETWPAGIYILQLEGPTGILSQRVVLQR